MPFSLAGLIPRSSCKGTSYRAELVFWQKEREETETAQSPQTKATPGAILQAEAALLLATFTWIKETKSEPAKLRSDKKKIL